MKGTTGLSLLFGCIKSLGMYVDSLSLWSVGGSQLFFFFFSHPWLNSLSIMNLNKCIYIFFNNEFSLNEENKVKIK